MSTTLAPSAAAGPREIDPFAGASPRRLARMAGVLYLINILGGAFAIGIVPAMLVVSDPATTVHNIGTHELLYRSSLAAHVVVTLTCIPMAMIFYELFKVVSRRLALLDVFFILVATAIEAAGLVNQFTPLVLLGNEHYANALPAAQLNALAYLPLDLSGMDYYMTGGKGRRAKFSRETRNRHAREGRTNRPLSGLSAVSCSCRLHSSL